MAQLADAHADLHPPDHMVGRIREIAAHHELLLNLVRLELKAKYKASALGFAWSLLNPAMYLVVFYVAFDLILGGGIPRFPIYLLSGLLVWNFFTAALNSGTGSIVAGQGLVKKVWFPREVLPLASVGAALVHFFLQLPCWSARSCCSAIRSGWAEDAARAAGPAGSHPAGRRPGSAVLGGQRLPAGHGPLRRAGPAGLVLGHADRLPLHPARLGVARPHRHCPAEPGHTDRRSPSRARSTATSASRSR